MVLNVTITISNDSNELTGCQSAYISMEVKGPDANVLNRRCVLLRWVDLSKEKFTELIERGTGSLLVLMPPDYAMAGSNKLKEWMKLEQYLLSSGTSIPVYFTVETAELTKIYEDVYHAAVQDKNSTAAAGETVIHLVTHSHNMS